MRHAVGQIGERMKLTLGLLIAIGLASCTPQVTKVWTKNSTIIYSDKKAKSGYVQIKKVTDPSLGQSDIIAEKYVDKKIIYRLYYGCSLFETRKETYTYCSRGQLLIQENYNGTSETGTDYKTRLTPLDKFVLHKIDSCIRTENQNQETQKLCQKEIKGFKQKLSQ